jgi:hypothetical protein
MAGAMGHVDGNSSDYRPSICHKPGNLVEEPIVLPSAVIAPKPLQRQPTVLLPTLSGVESGSHGY